MRRARFRRRKREMSRGQTVIAALLVATARLLSGARVVRTTPWETGQQTIYFANHTSHLDFMVLWSALPPALRKRVRPVAGKDYWRRGPIRRYLARNTFKAILIERGRKDQDRASSVAAACAQIDRIAAKMGGNDSLIVFPEGTRGTGREILPFKSGLYHLWRAKPGVRLVPVYLENMHHILPKGSVIPMPRRGRVIFGEPLRLSGDESKEEFLERARDALIRMRDS